MFELNMWFEVEQAFGSGRVGVAESDVAGAEVVRNCRVEFVTLAVQIDVRVRDAFDDLWVPGGDVDSLTVEARLFAPGTWLLLRRDVLEFGDTSR